MTMVMETRPRTTSKPNRRAYTGEVCHACGAQADMGFHVYALIAQRDSVEGEVKVCSQTCFEDAIAAIKEGIKELLK